LPWLDAAALLLGVEHDILALLVKLIEVLTEGLLGLVSGVQLFEALYEMMTIQTILQPWYIFFHGTAGYLGIEPLGGKPFDLKERLANQTYFLKIHHK
jgi:hypothetical protein